MEVIPAVDLRGGACVQWVGGSPQDERVRLPDPVAVARRWRDAGFRSLHLVDLDAALGGVVQDEVIARILAATALSCSVGGGIRDLSRATALLAAGAAQVVVGTRAIQEPGFLSDLCTAFPDRVVLAADVKNESVVIRGWTASAGLRIDELLARVDGLPLAAVLVTAVHVEGRLEGPDLRLIETARAATRRRLIASGGVSSLADLRALSAVGADAAILGMSLYTGAIDPLLAAAEFSR